MMNLSEFRQQYPQYNDLSDEQLTQALQKSEVAKSLNISAEAPAAQSTEAPTTERRAQIAANTNAMRGLLGVTQPIVSSQAQNLQPAVDAALTGFNTGVERTAHGALQVIGNQLPTVPAIAEASGRVAAQREAAYEKAAANYPTVANVASIAGGIGATTPLLLLGGGAPGLLRAVGQGALQGAGAGFLQYVPEGGSRTVNTLFGGALGGAIPLGFGAAVQGAKLLKKPATYVAEKVMQGVDAVKTLKNKQAADRLGLTIYTPAEASGSPLAAAEQGRRGTSPAGALKMQKMGDERLAQEQKIVGDLLDDLSPDGSSAAGEVRGVAKTVFNKEEKALAAAAKPLYQRAYAQPAPGDELLQLASRDGNIETALKDVMTDPLYKLKLSEATPNSIQVWDLVKRNVGRKIAAAKRDGDKEAAMILEESQNSLLNILDNASPEYAAARALYSEGAKPLQKLRESNLGRLANLNDMQLKNVSKIIFDPAETDIKVLMQLRDNVVKQSPDTWGRIVRNEIERKLDMAKGSSPATNFYNAFLAKPRDYRQLLVATQGLPNVRQKLVDMKAVFKDLIEPISAKTAARLAKSSLDVPRSSIELARNVINNFLGGKFDKAAVDLMFSPTWDKELAKVVKINNKASRVIELGKLLSRVSAIETADANNQIFGGANNAPQQ